MVKKIEKEQSEELIEKTISINRVAKVVKGGRRFGFSALVVVGDGNGKVGVGFGKAREVPIAVNKGIELAKKNLVEIPLKGHTFPYAIIGKYGQAKVLIKPASPGTGIVAGSTVRAVMEALGIRDVLTKSLGSNNPINVVHATMQALKEIKVIEEKEKLRQAG
ncbi:TPA: 30S ribosomal protein S5 [bacterium]|nr:30S ribosomal protein S5 [bacterium]